MIRSIKYWFRYKWRKLRGICQTCGVDPVNNKRPITSDPFYSETHCRFCMKRWLFASNYGMSRETFIRLIAKI